MTGPTISKEILDLDIFLSLDYSQAEIRLLAEISGDEKLITLFNSSHNVDIHSMVGSQLTGWSVERIKNEEVTRKMVKNQIFGIVFGIGRENLYDYIVGKIRAVDGENANLTGVTKAKVVALYDKFFQTYTGVARYIADYRDQAEKTGVVSSIFGLNREVRADDDSRGTYWLNQAINFPIQCSAHQLVLMAIALLHMKPKTYNQLQRPCMEVHDALYFFVKFRNLLEAYQQASKLLETDVVEYAAKNFNRRLRIPMIAEAKAGFCLGSLVKFDGQPLAELLTSWRKKHQDVEAKGWKELLKTGEIISV